jgi:predicted XRE-type DNA-binding protein/predicted nuclease of predicted toxin-antitoxin system
VARYLIDANLPRWFSLWAGGDCEFVHDLGAEWSDTRIWNHAAAGGLTIVSKDADFSDRAFLTDEGPSVIHIRVGNLTMVELHRYLTSVWLRSARRATPAASSGSIETASRVSSSARPGPREGAGLLAVAKQLREWKSAAMKVEAFDSVFDALADTPAEAADMTARADLLLAIRERVKAWQAMGGLTQEEATARLGLTRPRLNDLMRGKLDKFSLDALVNIAAAAGFRLHIGLEDVKAA